MNVASKGKARSKVVYLVADCRTYVDDYFATERHRDDDGQDAPLIISVRGGFLAGQTVNAVLDEIAATAALQVHPHQLRHAFGWDFREKTGSDSEIALALGTHEPETCWPLQISCDCYQTYRSASASANLRIA